jgi:hypothetical protein
MVRIAFALGLLGLLAFGASPAAASPRATNWWFWLSKPERHGSRKMPGDFRPVYGSYRLHSHERPPRRTMPGDFKPNYATYHHNRARKGFFSFLHFGRRPGGSGSHSRSSGSSHGSGRMTL